MAAFSLLASWVLFFAGVPSGKAELGDVVRGVVIFSAPILLVVALGRHFLLMKKHENG
jgi:hypothetical protein